ncbi:protein of unknown function [Sporobacter termitidis DSM 10068]|uniref:Transcobalamin-like C-terminal domain-containing protein n=1 Tax=Sporobacter termitidis DSM 10068 TaxID=1123282 RepID=A0A1M5XH71_9FIRM|nr:DUF4430 domain-containing protein [Sporobacter termitidis]SHH98888.1 protein of unknown function [Sporobacter termitidis DSM 10068]
MKNLFKKHRWKAVGALLVLCALGFAFWYGGNAPGLRGWTAVPPSAASSDVEAAYHTEPGASPSGVSPAAVTSDAPESPGASATPDRQPSAPPSAAPSAEPASPPPGSTGGKALSADEKVALAKALTGGKSSEGVEQGSKAYAEAQGMTLDPTTGKDQYKTAPVPSGKPVPVEPDNAVVTDEAHTCTLSVRCDVLLDNISWLDPDKVELVPEDGVIFPATAVTFYEGESVFNVLQREMKKAGIQMEFKNTPMYNSAYIKGIGNLYEFDCGELSGWLYKVNDWFPNYGCSRYQLKEGDVIEWVYTTDLGADVGGYYAAGGS